MISTFGEVEASARQQTNVSEAAKETGVKQMVYASAVRADVSDFFLAPPHRERENIIKESDIPYVFVRMNWYVDKNIDLMPSSLIAFICTYSRNTHLNFSYLQTI